MQEKIRHFDSIGTELYTIKKMPTLTFARQSQRVQVKEGTELLHLFALYPSLPLKFGCRQGQCGTCAIRIEQGMENLSPKTKEEQATLSRLQLGSERQRLACQCALKGDVTIY